MSFEYETILLVKKEVFVYNLPPRQSNRGYRASEWNLESPAWTGRMRVVAKGKTLFIKLEDSVSGQLYAQCPVEEFPGIAVEQVLDSSRYFAIRLMADNGCTMYVGIGFAERSDSFDFNVAIQDHFTHQKQEEEAERQASHPQPSEPALDLGLKEGQRLRLNINTKRSGEGVSASKTASRPMPSLKLGTPAGPGLLPPPPPPTGSRSRSNRAVPSAPTVAPSVPTGNKSNADLLVDLFQSPTVAPTAAAAVTTNSDSLLDWTS
uniref:Adaptin ear-binding coat-associated protein 2 n=2 Tax=Schistocephalus solidus TaxID=70667 RepID=A0A0X3P551_SCHSO